MLLQQADDHEFTVVHIIKVRKIVNGIYFIEESIALCFGKVHKI